jgi:pimeloyl-ACP methyl ester carboxylesterase
MFVRVFVFRVGVVHRKRLTAGVRSACLAPHPTRSSPRGVLVFSREIPASGTGRLERRFEQHFRSKPARIMWAMRDPASTPAFLELWRKTSPDAPVMKLQDAGYFSQEDTHERIVPELLSFPAATHHEVG